MSRFVVALITAVLCCLCSHAALAGPRKPKVVIVHSIDPASAANVQSTLLSSGLFEAVDTINAGTGGTTPTLAQLTSYDAALVTNADPWADRDLLGTTLKQYVDAGSGVVQTTFTVNGAATGSLGGGWTADYNCITFSGTTGGSASLGTIAQPNHPIMNGVATFSGGSAGYRPVGTALTPGATLVASWSDGKPLVAVGPKINRADLGFYPVSSAYNPNFWDTNTDGAKLLANALMSVIRPKVLLVHSMVQSHGNDAVAKLRSTTQFSRVDTFLALNATPSLAELQAYDAIMLASSGEWSSPSALGSVVADYVDWGGGVVVACFAAGSTGRYRLGGRFTGDYEILTATSTTTGAASLGAITYTEHPILAGVATFAGGVSSFRPSTSAMAPGGLIVAQWSDGMPLVAVSTRRKNRADLGMYPPSSSVGSAAYWNPTTDGAKLMANALMYTIRPYVGIADSEAANVAPNTRDRLIASRRFSGVSILPKLNTATPSAATLAPFGVVFCFGNQNFVDATTFGNRLADYIDAGGSAVVAGYSLTNDAGFSNSRPRGRWISEGYDITPEGTTGATNSFASSLGAFVDPDHPVRTFVRKFASGATPRQIDDPLLRGRRLIQWSDGRMLASIHSFRRRVDLGFGPGSSSEFATSWNVRSDGTTIINNALEFAAFMKPCPGDFNGDGFVDDADFVLFAGFYNDLLDPRGDLSGDSNTDDADFVTFANGYNALLCP